MPFKRIQKGLIKTSLIVTTISILGKAIGFIRDAVIAAYYGANAQTDAFFFAQSMPSIIFPAVCNSISTAFLSIYVTQKVADEKTADLYASKAISFSTFLAIILSLIAVLLTPILIPVFAPGFSLTQKELAIELTRVTMAAFALTMMQYMFGAILSGKKMFYGAQLAALIFNVSVIVITILFGYSKSMMMLTYTVVLGQIIQIICLVLFLRRNFDYTFSVKIFDREAKTLLHLTIPILLGNCITQINNIVDKTLSSLYGDGTMSALSYSNTLNRFITGILITTLSTVVYPVLTEQYSRKQFRDYGLTIRKSLVFITIVIMPISLITTICASDIVKIVYERGNFNTNASQLTASALRYYGMMYVFCGTQEIITRAFYSVKDSKTPVKAAAWAILSNTAMSFIFSWVLKMGVAGIALGTTLSSIFAASFLLSSLRKRIPEVNVKEMGISYIKIIFASLIDTGIIIAMKYLFSSLHPLFRFAFITITCFTVHIGILYVLKCKELIDIRSILIDKKRTTKNEELI